MKMRMTVLNCSGVPADVHTDSDKEMFVFFGASSTSAARGVPAEQRQKASSEHGQTAGAFSASHVSQGNMNSFFAASARDYCLYHVNR